MGTDIKRLKNGQPRMVSILPEYIKKPKLKGFIKEKDKDCLIGRSYYDSYSYNLDLSVFFTDIATIYKENPLEAIEFILPRDVNDFLKRRLFKKGYGLEFRLFDELEPKYIKDIVRFLLYLGENANNTINIKKDYIYNNKIWNDEMI